MVGRAIEPVALDGFRHFEPIGSGGFSRVFRAWQSGIDRWVAVKVLNVGVSDDRERQAFERECRAMGQLSQHPHIVTVFTAVFTSLAEPAIVMELYTGGNLGERVKSTGPLRVEDVLSTGVKIAGALHTAHHRGVLHRDIKPNNLFVSEYGEPALGDFGISTFDGERTVTGGGGLTLQYAPPEVLENEPATPQSEAYSLAATLYTLAAGARPFGGRNQSSVQLVTRILREDPPPLPPGVPRELDIVLRRAMSKRADARPSTLAEFAEELRSVQRTLSLPPTTPALSIEQISPPVAGSESGSPSTMTRTTAADRPPIVDRDGEFDDAGSGSVTIARPRVTGATGAPMSSASPGRRRRTVGAALSAAVVSGVGIMALFMTGNGASDPGRPTVTSAELTSATTNGFYEVVSPPSEIALSRTDDATVTVTWTSGDATARVIVERIDQPDLPPVESETTSASIAAAPGERPCVVLRAISNRGRVSQASEATCLP
jgi:serine/threonine protein kinase